jgi:hypothetical protein
VVEGLLVKDVIKDRKKRRAFLQAVANGAGQKLLGEIGNGSYSDGEDTVEFDGDY